MYTSQSALFLISALAFILPSANAIAGGPAFNPDLVTSRIDMFDDDQTACQTYYGGFMLGGPKYLAIGVGDKIFKGGAGCGQCLQLEYNGKTAVGMAADWHSTLLPSQLDVSPAIADKLGFGGNNPDPKAVKVSYVSCGVDKSLNLGGTLKYFFGPGSKDTSLEVNILGGFHPIASVVATIKGAPFTGTRDGGKFRFGPGFVLKADSVITFTVTFDDGSSVTDNVSVATIASGLGGGGLFFKGGAIATTDKVGNNKVNPAALTWPDFVMGTSPLKG